MTAPLRSIVRVEHVDINTADWIAEGWKLWLECNHYVLRGLKPKLRGEKYRRMRCRACMKEKP